MQRSLPLARTLLPALILTLLLPSCGSLGSMIENMDKPGVRVVGIPEVEQLSLDGAALKFPVELSNPYDVPLPVSQMDFALSGRAGTFLDGKQNLQGMVPAGARRCSPPRFT